MEHATKWTNIHLFRLIMCQACDTHTHTHTQPPYLLDKPLAVLDSEQCLMHAVRGGQQIVPMTGQHVRVELWFLRMLAL